MALLSHAAARIRRAFYADPTALELVLGVQSLAWAICLALPPATFGSSQSFALFAAVAGERAWSLVCLAVGLLQVAGAATERTGLRRAGNMVSFAFWGMVGALVGLANPSATGAYVYAVSAAAAAWAFLQAGAAVRNGDLR